MSTAIAVVDAFAARPFTGNPAAVCILESWPADGWLQSLAAEMNLSETACVVPQPDGRWHLRWFTPATEVDLCGHATLASAHRLWETGRLGPGEPALFETRSGTLTCRRSGDWIVMDFPAMVPRPAPPEEGLAEALGVSAIAALEANGRDLIAEVASETDVRQATPDFRRLLAGGFSRTNFMLTARADSPDIDFVSRFFAPADGIDEDPVTGSAHCGLAPYWAGRLGKRDMTGHQVSTRGGIVRVGLRGDRVEVAGQVVTVWEGALKSAAQTA